MTSSVEDRPLEGAVALVTGGGSGIGRAAALGLADRGAAVLVAGRREDALKRTAATHSGIRTAAGDVSQAADAERIVRAALAISGRLEILVNNAGAVTLTPLGETEPEAALGLWATNVLAPTLLARFALPHLERSRGTIVNVSSTFGHKPAPGISQYGASKAALEHLTRSWALELALRPAGPCGRTAAAGVTGRRVTDPARTPAPLTSAMPTARSWRSRPLLPGGKRAAVISSRSRLV